MDTMKKDKVYLASWSDGDLNNGKKEFNSFKKAVEFAREMFEYVDYAPLNLFNSITISLLQ